ncbi:sigma-70 family RNA polymerase sigma factor [candidate division KSB1 bacterium]|nr:sigma-70 family RNA polymerase sigma factor [candidate division KSB1 bacterium]
MDQENHIEFELVRRAQGGDSKAFEELVMLSDRQVLTLAYHMTGNLADAQDVYQETFLRAFRGLQGFRFQSSFRTWLLRIATNQAINWRAKRRLRLFSQPHESDAEDSSCSQFVDNSDPSATVHVQEILQHIRAGMDFLSAKERAVFTLRHFEGTKIKEIAAMLGCAEGTVKNLLFRATKKLQKALSFYTEE